ncbi:MAG: tRNA (adenosine(37)-N6)-threonylcarbamoyltransferase complex dimerization subunit type 1 TsaB [Gammaproteobacteria bacterium]|nr:tRNA (adenosine(37)-N6)-threonylcarbamoyltransferase complex dimerization subunit type 1 TsaB [Gammaproteobacteria bacterium]
MKLLALDTSSLACAVGVMHDDSIVSRYEEQPREHTRLLIPMIREVLAEAEVELTDLDAIVLGNGPGSFIGMRIAASVAQGLAFGAGLEIVPVSSLAVVAASAGNVGDIVVVAQDAHLQQVYLGVYEIDSQGISQEIVTERLQSQQEIAELCDLDEVVAAGSGWLEYPALLDANRKHIHAISEVLYPSTEPLLAIGAAACDAGATVPPDRVNPAYLRQKVAEKPRPAKP